MYDFLRYIRAAPEGALAIDCGANVGDVTAVMIREGMRVIAFEPDPTCVADLNRRFAGESRVTIVPKAVGATARRVPFFRQIARGKPVTVASSIVQMAHHQPEPAGEIEVIDLIGFIDALAEPVHLLKIDIEGAEAEVLESYLERGVDRPIGRIFVEMHEWLDPGLAERLGAVRQRLAEAQHANIDLDWG